MRLGRDLARGPGGGRLAVGLPGDVVDYLVVSALGVAMFGPTFGQSFRATFRNAAIQQSFLLDYTLYNLTPVNELIRGREFLCTTASWIYGIRLNGALTGNGTVGLRLYRVADQVLLASRNGMSVIAGENNLYFTNPVRVAAATLYRIACADAQEMKYRDATDHPDGTVVTLTSNTFCYLLATDGYPSLTRDGLSSSVEPIVYV